jgi:uncharacterized protein HemX
MEESNNKVKKLPQQTNELCDKGVIMLKLNNLKNSVSNLPGELVF